MQQKYNNIQKNQAKSFVSPACRYLLQSGHEQRKRTVNKIDTTEKKTREMYI